MKSKAIQFLEANQSGDRSTFVDDAKWRRDNAAWLKLSHRISYAIMDYMQENTKHVTTLQRNLELALSL